MPVLGLAGHVDHGKTSLVRALTGVDTDRLPEEKARGMTTDLGFAPLKLTDPATGTPFEAGLIDVPGHERYIRNMASGAWAVDAALLVVAADDGWMAQTETHARVLAAFGAPRVLVAVTKTDLVPASRVLDVMDDAARRACAILGPDQVAVPPLAVCAPSGEGLAELRDALAGVLAPGLNLDPNPTARPGADPPYLFVDRMFSAKGAGLVLCGTLRGGPLRPGDTATRLPDGERHRIKALECQGERADIAYGGSRVAVNVARSGSGEVGRGDLLAFGEGARSEFLVAGEFLVRLGTVPRSSGDEPPARVLSRGGEVEVAAGSAHRIADLRPTGRPGLYRILFDRPLAVPPDLPLVLIRHGGADILGVARILIAGRTDKRARSIAIQETEAFERRRAAEGTPETPGLRAEIRSAIEKARAAPVRPTAPAPSDHRDFLADPRVEAAARVLAAAGARGVDIAPAVPGSRAGAPFGARELAPLCDQGIAVPLDRTLFLHRDAYAALLRLTLAGLQPGDTLTVGDAKARTGFSRKFVLPFLNRLERDGYVRRAGDLRLVLKPAPAAPGAAAAPRPD